MKFEGLLIRERKWLLPSAFDKEQGSDKLRFWFWHQNRYNVKHCKYPVGGENWTTVKSQLLCLTLQVRTAFPGQYSICVIGVGHHGHFQIHCGI